MHSDKIQIENTVAHFQFEGMFIKSEVYGSGHINNTYAVHYIPKTGSPHRYILQRINKYVFNRPVELMENIERITQHLRKAIQMSHGDPDRESLTLVPTANGSLWYQDPDGEFWRAYLFIEDAVCLQLARTPSDLYHAARAFGKFQMLLSDFPANLLHESIVDFHHTPKRFKAFQDAVDSDIAGRAAGVQTEIDFILKREKDTGIIVEAIENGQLPLRVTHNDTKLNNVMLDVRTGEEVCVIDLDTVMPGTSLYDYGDAIRTGATTALEDEKDLQKVSLDLEKAGIFTKGFLETAGHVFTVDEIDMLPWGAKLMTLENGIRFLTDHLNGDRYFRIHRPEHNLDRCRTQLALVADMEKKWPAYRKMINQLK